jgi:hypothetical protein
LQCLLVGAVSDFRGAKRFGTFGGSDPRFVWQAQDIVHLLIRVARARSISCTLLKRWQAWVKMRGAARGDLSHVVNLTAVFNFSKLLFRETVVTFGLAMLRCNTSDASASFFSWQARYFFQKLLTSVNDNSEVQCCFGRRVSLSWRGASFDSTRATLSSLCAC